MEIQVKKWGNSLGIRIPRSIANQINIQDGSKINLILKNNKIEFSPVVEEEYQLNDLLNKMTDTNIHNETTSGQPLGQEVW